MTTNIKFVLFLGLDMLYIICHSCKLKTLKQTTNNGEPIMKYSLLGKSGLRVSELALGAMTFGTEWGWGTEKNEARKMLELYVDNGGNFVDTANVYTNGSSERMLGEFLGEKRQQIVLSTKYTINTRPGDPNRGGNNRK